MSPARRAASIFGVAALLLTLACVAAALASPMGLVPQLTAAEARWRATGVTHYRMTVRWTYGSIVVGPWQIEVRDEQVIAGDDLERKRPLTRSDRKLAQLNLPIARLFASVRDEVTPSIGKPPASILASHLSGTPIHAALDRCAARLPSVVYDARLSYPRGITVYGSPCYRASEWTVQVLDFVVLPS